MMTLTSAAGSDYLGEMAVTKPSRRKPAGAIGVALALAAALTGGTARAQRGEDYVLERELSVAASPDDGFPGLFDTQLARQGAFVANLPATSIYYGVTSELSVGTILWSYIPLFSGLPGGSIHARYRLGSTSWFRTTVDALLLGAKLPRDDSRGETPLGLALFGSNTEFAPHANHRLTVSAWLGQISSETEEGEDTGLAAVLLGGTYSLVFARWCAFHLTALYLFSGSAELDQTGAAIDVDWAGGVRTSDRLLGRAMFSLRAGHWLFNVGAAKVGSTAIPWLNVAFSVGGS
ncbi:MAG: hypothetical protein ABW217_01810 [Polyangiaceae bacterium]